jgi:hypothetical protein
MKKLRFEKGELGRWLRVIADADDAGVVPSVPVPEAIAESLEVLRCVQRTPAGRLTVTEKGRLALRMEDPSSLYWS